MFRPVTIAFRLFLLPFFVLLTGCVSHRSLAENSVGFNLAVEQAQNEMLLLNAVRASLRRPMYVSGISKVTGGLTSTVSTTLSIPFGKKADANTGTPGATFSANPTFEVPVLDSQEFMTGFLKPLDKDLLALYWEQGWPRELLLHLLIQRAVVREEYDEIVEEKKWIHGIEYVFENYPEIKFCQIPKFSRVIDNYLLTDPVLVKQATFEPVGPAISRTDIGGLKQLMAASKDNFQITTIKNAPPGLDVRVKHQTFEWILKTKASPSTLRSVVKKQKKTLCAGESAAYSYHRVKPTPEASDEELLSVSADASENQIHPQPGGANPPAPTRTKENPEVTVTFVLRSPEAVLYYLGELIRAEGTNSVHEICIQGKQEPLFVAIKASQSQTCKRGIVNTQYDKEHYLIPPTGTLKDCPALDNRTYTASLECNSGRSMQALSLINQLISLQKSAKELPTISIVRTIGQ